MNAEPWDAFFDAHYVLTYAPLQPDARSRAEALAAVRSLGYAGEDEDRIVLREIRRILRPAGRLLMETSHRDRLPPRSPAREWHPLGNGAFLLSESRVDRVAGVVDLTHTYLPASGPPQTRTIRWRAYSATELVRMLVDVGFGEIACYGTLDGGPFGPDTRLVLLATAPAV